MKYGNKKVRIDGILFDSKKEATRYAELKMMEKAGLISELELQKEFELIPAQFEGEGKRRKCIERAVKYKADFYYFDFDSGRYVCEDVKGYKGGSAYAIFTIKRKMMLYMWKIRIIEI